VLLAGPRFVTDQVRVPVGRLQGFRPGPMVDDYVYRHDPTSGETTVVADGFDKPNGIAFSPDERVLYLTDSGASQEAGSYHVTRAARGVGGGRRRRVADVDQPSGLVVARPVNVLGALGPLASSNASPVGSRQMIASYPRDPVIARVGEGFGSLLVHCTARRLSLENREITILGTNGDPVATYQQSARTRSEPVGRLPGSDRPEAVLSSTPGAARIG
jgi:hypothetical protein